MPLVVLVTAVVLAVVAVPLCVLQIDIAFDGAAGAAAAIVGIRVVFAVDTGLGVDGLVLMLMR